MISIVLTPNTYTKGFGEVGRKWHESPRCRDLCRPARAWHERIACKCGHSIYIKIDIPLGPLQAFELK